VDIGIGHHRQKWKLPILGVAQIVLRDVFWLLFFLRTWNQNFFSAYAQENSPVQPLVLGVWPVWGVVYLGCWLMALLL
jgi:hypothetical protein